MEKESFEVEELSRRTFLTRLIGLMGGLITLVMGGAGTLYFASPLWQKKEEPWVDIGPVKDFPVGAPVRRILPCGKEAWTTIESKASAG